MKKRPTLTFFFRALLDPLPSYSAFCVTTCPEVKTKQRSVNQHFILNSIDSLKNASLTALLSLFLIRLHNLSMLPNPWTSYSSQSNLDEVSWPNIIKFVADVQRHEWTGRKRDMMWQRENLRFKNSVPKILWDTTMLQLLPFTVEVGGKQHSKVS